MGTTKINTCMHTFGGVQFQELNLLVNLLMGNMAARVAISELEKEYILQGARFFHNRINNLLSARVEVAHPHSKYVIE